MKTKIVLFIFIALIAALFSGWLWNAGYGYILITNGESTLAETTISRISVLILPVLFILFLLNWLLIKIWRFPSFFKNRRLKRSRKNIIQGLIELTEGHWQKAEQILLRDIDDCDTPLLNYLLAARAAQQQDADERRDQYLKQAHEVTPKADIAIGLTQAELQLAHGQTEQALATLTNLREIAPKHPYVLKLLSRLYAQVNEWEKLAILLPEIRKRKIVSGDKMLDLERKTYTQFILFIARSSAVFSLEEQWKLLPKRYRDDPEIFRVYVNCLIESDKHVLAEKLLRGFLNKHWDENLAQLYGRVEILNFNKQLDYAEAWLKDHGRSPMLLLSLARLCYRLQLWGKARVYYESSIAILPSVEAYAELAELLESLGESDSSHECFRKGLDLATSIAHNRRASDRIKPPLEETQNKNNDKKPLPAVNSDVKQLNVAK